MATTLTQAYPQYTWLFLAVRRADMHSRPHRQQITAPDYHTARRLISRDYIAAFAGRIPCRSPGEAMPCPVGSRYSGNGNSPTYTFAP
ncbi:TPA: host cell division inhibitor Icd-like protein [Enterobacter asburiae]|nr:host cell division inhibitor Icd-like protein [Enterobacter asburiae]